MLLMLLKDGETAFDIAKNKNRNDIIVLLYAHSSKLRSHHPVIDFSLNIFFIYLTKVNYF